MVNKVHTKMHSVHIPKQWAETQKNTQHRKFPVDLLSSGWHCQVSPAYVFLFPYRDDAEHMMGIVYYCYCHFHPSRACRHKHRHISQLTEFSLSPLPSESPFICWLFGLIDGMQHLLHIYVQWKLLYIGTTVQYYNTIVLSSSSICLSHTHSFSLPMYIEHTK